MLPISARDKAWNSATTLYIARKIQQLAEGRRLSVLDMGCGAGSTMLALAEYGHDLHGFDLPDRADALRSALVPNFRADYDSHVRIMDDERVIPFDAQMFDVVYSNQVFEHIRFIDQMFAEIARVLRPGGHLVTLFPLASYPLEGHSLVPFAHWIPPGPTRRRYLRAWLTLRVGRRIDGMSAALSAAEWDERLREYTFYRFFNEFGALFSHYFERWEVDTSRYVIAKADLLKASANPVKRVAGVALRRLEGPFVNSCVTYGFNAAFCASCPKPKGARRNVMQWRA